MEEALISLYQTLDPMKFKYFVVGSDFYVHANDLRHLPADLRPKEQQKKCILKIQNIEIIIRELLTVRMVAVEEYTNFTLSKRGFPGDFGDFLDVCITEKITPTVFAVSIVSENLLDVSFVSDSRIMHCTFHDDDLLSNLFSLCSSNNCVEIFYNNQKLERIFHSWGIPCILVKCSDSVSMLRSSLKTDVEVVEFQKRDCCLVNISDFDLVDFGLATQQGKRLLDQWLRSPCIDQEEIERRLDISECFCGLQLPFSRFPDLKKIIFRIQNKSVTMQEVVKLCQTIGLAGDCYEAVKSHQELLKKDKVDVFNEAFVKPLEKFEAIFRPIIAEVAKTLNFETLRVHVRLSDDLERLESQKFAVLAEIESEFLRVKKYYPRVSFLNRHFKISRLDYNQSDFESKGYVVSSVLKTGVQFLTKTLSEKNEEVAKIEQEAEKIEKEICSQLVAVLSRFTGSFETFNYLLALMDIYAAFSTKINTAGYSRPTFSTGRYEIDGMFHPVLEHRDCILNSIKFTSPICILTGPNMGGKSTFVRALSMVSLYAQIGCYVPARSATVPIFDRIYLRIGARDCSSRKQSTFMVEMLELNRILRTATSKSLVLIDELGRGTSAIDGLSLALAVRDFLLNLGAMTVMATHFSELGNDKTMNKRMLVEGNVLTYVVSDGVCDLSFGINVAEMVKFPSEVIESAKKYLST